MCPSSLVAREVEKDKLWNQTVHVQLLTRGCYNYSIGAAAASYCRNSQMGQGGETIKAENALFH